jgi:hypothetical protein
MKAVYDIVEVWEFLKVCGSPLQLWFLHGNLSVWAFYEVYCGVKILEDIFINMWTHSQEENGILIFWNKSEIG